MKAWDYDAVYYDGECYCNECLPPSVNIEGSAVRPVFCTDEADCYPVCTVCHRTHDYIGLTDYGMEHSK